MTDPGPSLAGLGKSHQPKGVWLSCEPKYIYIKGLEEPAVTLSRAYFFQKCPIFEKKPDPKNYT